MLVGKDVRVGVKGDMLPSNRSTTTEFRFHTLLGNGRKKVRFERAADERWSAHANP